MQGQIICIFKEAYYSPQIKVSRRLPVRRIFPVSVVCRLVFDVSTGWHRYNTENHALIKIHEHIDILICIYKYLPIFRLSACPV